MRKVRPSQLYLAAKEEILRYIQESNLKAGSLLPPEGDLCTRLGISRGTLRESMRILEEEGIIRRKQGLGTFLCEENLIRSTLDLNEGVSEMIAGKGMIPGSRLISMEEITAGKKLVEHLAIKPGSPVIRITRVRTADDVPVAYTVDFMPVAMLPSTFSSDFTGGSLYAYLENNLGIDLSNAMLRIQPVRAPKSIAQELDIKPGTLMMLLKQTDKTINNVPVLYSEEYFVADRFEFYIFRKGRKKVV